MKPSKQRMAIIVLTVLIMIAAVYIAVDKYLDIKDKQLAEKQNEQIAIYQQGLQVGYQQAILQVMQQLSTCDQVPLVAGNITLNAIWVECLR